MYKNKTLIISLVLIFFLTFINCTFSSDSKIYNQRTDTLPYKITETDYIPSENELIRLEEFPNSATVLADDGDFLWLETNKGLTKFNKLTEEKSYINENIDDVNSIIPSSLIKDKNGNLWFWVEPARGLAKFDGKNFHLCKLTIDISEPGVLEKNKNWIYKINRGDTKLDSAGNIWVHISGRKYDKLLKFDGEKWTDYSEENPGLKDKRIIDVIIKPDKSLFVWIETGLLKYDGNNFVKYKPDNYKLPNIKFDFGDNQCFYVNKNNELLILLYFLKITADTTYGEMAIINPASKKIYNSSGEISFDKYKDDFEIEGAHGESAIDKNGNLWISVYPRRDFPYMAGLYKFDGTKLIKYDNPITSSILIDKNDILWFGCKSIIHSMSGDAILGGFYRFDGNEFKKIRLSESPDYAFDFIFDKDNTGWFNTANGLAYLKDGKWYYKDSIARDRCIFGLDYDEDEIVSMCFDSDYNLWSFIQDEKNGRIILSRDKINEHEEYKKSVSGIFIFVLADKQNNIYLFPYDKKQKIFKFDRVKWDSLSCPGELFGFTNIWSDGDTSWEDIKRENIRLDENNNIIIRTSKKIGIFDGETWQIENSDDPYLIIPPYNRNDRMNTNIIKNDVILHDKSFFLIDYKGELSIFSNSGAENLFLNHGLRYNDSTIFLWGTLRGLYYYNTNYDKSIKILNVEIESGLLDNNGLLYLNSGDGLIIFDGKEFNIYKNLEFKNQDISGFDLKNNLWLRDYGGLSIFHKGGVVF